MNKLDLAERAARERSAYSPFPESPKAFTGDEKARGLAWFEGALGGALSSTGPGELARAEEVSPYTARALDVSYARPSVDEIFDAVDGAAHDWARADPERRVEVCGAALDALAGAVFENTFATMHTTGQPFMMAFAGSGANSLDRGLEALAFARRAMREVPASATFTRDFHRRAVTLEKTYRLIPRGPALVIACGSYPAWNAYPAIFANLACGNPVVVKAHPTTILPVARAVQIVREVLETAGFNPDVLVLATDTLSAPIGPALARDPRTAIIDFTGSPEVGAQLEALRGPLVFTETAGCNAVLIDSVRDVSAVTRAIAVGLSMHAGQMCTTPQNLFVPPIVATDEGPLTRDDFVERLVSAVDALSTGKAAAAIIGAVHSPATVERVRAMTGDVVRACGRYDHPEFPDARTLTPLILRERASDATHQREHFGPVSFVLPVEHREEMLERAAADVRVGGAIASYCYSTDAGFRDEVADAMLPVGASVGFNLVGQSPMNFTAAFSDFHVTGLNPAGNACLTDLAFVTSRFRIAQTKTEVA